MYTSSTNQQSEHEPLITNTNNEHYGDINSNANKSKLPAYSYKTKLFFITLLILTAIVIYQIFPRSHHHNTPLNANSNTNWVVLEQLHEKAKTPTSWTPKEVCNDDTEFILTFALTQQNTDKLHDHVMSVSDPKSDTFHEYWTPDEVRSYFAPSESSVDAVISWLNTNGFIEEQIEMLSSYGNVIKLHTNCGEANKLLNTKYMQWENSKSGKKHLRVEDGIYNIPDIIKEHLDFISPTIRFPLQRHTKTIEVLTHSKMIDIRKTKRSDRNWNAQDTDNLDESTIAYNDPPELKQLYNMDATVDSIMDGETDEDLLESASRQSIASFIEEYYEDADLAIFWDEFKVSPVSTMERYPTTQPEGYGSEAELDTQYITTTGAGIYTYVYYIDSDDIFVTLAEVILAQEKPASVTSISYGADEYELGYAYVTRCNTEFGKLALIGCTVFASSGDSGVLGNDDDCYCGDLSDTSDDDDADDGVGDAIHDEGRGGNNKNKNGDTDSSSSDSDSDTETDTSAEWSYIASFPGCAEYVTAVGGTSGGDFPIDEDSFTGEKAWLYSGGGFSVYFDRPSWQDSAVENYFANDDLTFPDVSRYNADGRAYPDMSAQSVAYVIAYESAFYLVSGTSCSSPTVAGMISMINYARSQSGKSSLGFLNPSLYSIYDDDLTGYYFNDILEGYNLGCSVDDDIGFYASIGWDPVTGLGTPKFSRLYQRLFDLD